MPQDSSPAARRCSLDGELTIYTAAARKDELLALLNGGLPLALDLSQLTSLDTAGLQLLLLVARQGALHGQAVEVVACSPEVESVLGFARLEGPRGLLRAVAPEGHR